MPKVKIVANDVQLDNATWNSLRKHTQDILDDFRPIGAKQVNLRLNESEQEAYLPVFIDWIALPSVSVKLAQRSPESDIGKYRLGEATPSRVYNDGLKQIGKKII